jgi:hypothetical protein
MGTQNHSDKLREISKNTKSAIKIATWAELVFFQFYSGKDFI